MEYNHRDKIYQGNIPYEAISYCWGDAQDQVPVECNGKSITIGRNLDQALRTFRLGDRPRTVWADALCINQQDQEEKHNQLKLMGYIYLRANQVLVYLGANANREADAFPLCNYLCATATNLGAGGLAQHQFRDALIQAAAGHIGPMRGDKEAQYRSLRALFALPYFTRVWTLQEVYLNPNVLFHCGPFVLEFMALFCGLYYTATNPVVLSHADALWPHTWSFLQLLSRKGEEDTHVPSELLEIVRPQRCLEPRDRVYAVTMMLRHLSLDKAVAPQQEDSNEVFIRAAAHFIGAEKCLNFISKADLLHNDTHGLPSWVPDWQYSRRPYQWFSTVWRRQSSFRPTKESMFSFEWRNTAELVLRGAVLSRVCAVTDVLPEQGEFLVGESLSAKPSDGDVQTSAQLFRKYLDYLVKFEPLVAFAEETQQMAKRPSETWKAFTAFDAADARCKGWSESNAEWRQLYDNFVQDIQAWAPFVKDGRHRGFRLHLENFRTQLNQKRRKQINNEFRSRLWTHGRRFARDEAGRLINATVHAQVGDYIALLVGGSMPYVLRARDRHYQLVGDCYIDGIMNGEAWEESRCAEIVLV